MSATLQTAARRQTLSQSRPAASRPSAAEQERREAARVLGEMMDALQAMSRRLDSLERMVMDPRQQ